MSESFREKVFPTLSLVIVCLVTTLLLTITYGATKDTIEARVEAEEVSARLAVMDEADDFIYLEGEEAMDSSGSTHGLYAAYKEDMLIGYVFDLAVDGYAGPISMVIGVSTNDHTITGLRIIEHTETPGLGGEATDAVFYEQFDGLGGDGVQISAVKTDANDTDEIEVLSAATVTTNSVVRGANIALSTTELLLDKGVGNE